MSNLVYPPSIPGLTYDSTRAPTFNTGIQKALTGKESRIAYQLYPLVKFELTYELLRDNIPASELKALVGLFIAVGGMWDTFRYTDPVFNTVAAMPFATVAAGDAAYTAVDSEGDPTNGTPYAITATYGNVGGPGGAELIQNFNGAPVFYGNGVVIPSSHYLITGTGDLYFSTLPAAATVLTWSGSFYYRCRFDEDEFTVTQFMANWWSTGKVTLQQVKL
jgi:hypothetical protein